MKSNQDKRQALVDAIESGQYKTGSNSDKTALIILAVFFIFIIVMTTVAGGIAGGMIGALSSIPLMLPMFIPIGIVLVVSSLNQGVDLGKLSEINRWLILNGEEIEAELDAIEQRGNMYIFRCSAEYAGLRRQFVSPSIRVQPIPFSEKKITVYINPQNPNQYLIDFYSHLPLAGNNVLHDRSEMKINPNKKSPTEGSYVLLVVICIVFFVPFGLISFLSGLGAILSKESAAGVGIIVMIVPLAVVSLAMYGILKYIKRSKEIAERGYYVPATATRFWVTHSKNNTTYHLSARYIEPSTKIVHDFHTTGPSSMKALVDSKVNVYLNPDNTREYFVDVKEAQQRLGFTASSKG